MLTASGSLSRETSVNFHSEKALRKGEVNRARCTNPGKFAETERTFLAYF
jgi:hypothetical protein